MKQLTNISQVYNWLYKKYGPQGWWPLSGIGYHPGDYSYPKTREQQFEICVGAILTQNTAWVNVEKALNNLKRYNALVPEKLQNLDNLPEIIKPAGYYNQKAKKLKIFAEFFQTHKTPTRKELLNLWGIGKETADSMLLYAYNVPIFVIDAYTKRIFSDIIDKNADYDDVQRIFEDKIEKNLVVYQEFHALIVEHGKNIRFSSKTSNDID